MKPVSPVPKPPSLESLRGIAYEDTAAAKAPIPIATASATISRSVPTNGVSPLRRPKSTHQLPPHKARSRFYDDIRRDSGLAASSSTTRNSGTTLATDIDSVQSMRHSPSAPSLAGQETISRKTSPRPKQIKEQNSQTSDVQLNVPSMPQLPFVALTNEIPTGSFEDLTIPGQVQFSNRGSMLIGGKKANNANGVGMSNGRMVGSRRHLEQTLPLSMPPVPTRVLSADDEALSHRVRSLYDRGGYEEGAPKIDANIRRSNNVAPDQTQTSNSTNPSALNLNGQNATLQPPPSRAASTASKNNDGLLRDDTELAGGIEDWEDLQGGDVDRYGFIVPKRLPSQPSSLHSGQPKTPDPPRMQRMSTLLQLASEAPRRQHSHRGKRRLAKSPARSAKTPPASRPPSEVARPTSSQSSYRSTHSASRFRTAANKLPHNKDRKCVDEAGDMLTLPPGLADIAEDEEDSKLADDLKRREWERNEKWRKMAKEVKTNKHGGGMVFDFDTKSPRVIERTWKGIPDRWRAAAWHSFLTTSAKKQRNSPTDDELIAVFKKLLHQGSPDDVQIDIDVPRTISSHIMFRRRYRGGQRLLFRVLHCMSIYFPDTGYVQGMAALAATFLCYFDEEMTFVMMVRVWQLRGLERLYQSGFEGLMQALDEFEKTWIGKGEVASKLVSKDCHCA